MSNTCKDLCRKYKPEKYPVMGSRYDHGLKRCAACVVFIKYEGVWCPCCGMRLRTKTRLSREAKRIG